MKQLLCIIINWFKRPASSVVVTPLYTTDHDGRVIKDYRKRTLKSSRWSRIP